MAKTEPRGDRVCSERRGLDRAGRRVGEVLAECWLVLVRLAVSTMHSGGARLGRLPLSKRFNVLALSRGQSLSAMDEGSAGREGECVAGQSQSGALDHMPRHSPAEGMGKGHSCRPVCQGGGVCST